MSEVGLAILFDRAGGKLTSKMVDAISAVKVGDAYETMLLGNFILDILLNTNISKTLQNLQIFMNNLIFQA